MVQLDFGAVLSQWPLLARGVAWTLGLTAISAVLGVATGIACAWARVHGAGWLRWAVGAYVELVRNTPFLVQL
ncbi:MAG: ABC transporter permease subunit, partial [Hydrogenophaga sp.]|uniref:ABC transporter permease subunit n=1 Tax=Hydrogenophaga sp. TaxID=1904254 RepID=UPI001E0EC54B